MATIGGRAALDERARCSRTRSPIGETNDELHPPLLHVHGPRRPWTGPPRIGAKAGQSHLTTQPSLRRRPGHRGAGPARARTPARRPRRSRVKAHSPSTTARPRPRASVRTRSCAASTATRESTLTCGSCGRRTPTVRRCSTPAVWRTSTPRWRSTRTPVARPTARDWRATTTSATRRRPSPGPYSPARST